MGPLPQPPLMVITDRSQASCRLEDIADAVFAGGCRWLSLRDKDLAANERVRLLYRLVAIAERYKATVSVHEDFDAALATGAAGVHLSLGGSIVRARRYLGSGALIGASAHNLDEVRSAAALGADYVTLSPIFASASKPGYGPAIGLRDLGAIARQLTIPIVALSGIDETNAASCIEAGAAGIAVMGAAMRADDPGAMIQRLVASLGDALAARAARGHSLA